MENSVNNSIYNELGERWYHANDDPVALLRAEAKLIAPWVLKSAESKMKKRPEKTIELGCGGGFISNYLARQGLDVLAFDLSKESLAVAKKYDQTNSVDYRIGDVTKVPYEDSSCDLVVCSDVLEHVDEPQKIVTEAYRLLKPGGMFFFHTFNRNFLSYLIIIKFVEWFVKNTPKNMHVLPLFVKPSELEKWCLSAGFSDFQTIGIRPSFRTFLDLSTLRGVVPENLAFKFTNNNLLSYAGSVVKMISKIN